MMKKCLRRGLIAALLLVVLSGCESTGYRSSIGISSGYYGGGWNDPFYYRPCCRGHIPVRPPPMYRPPMGGGRPAHMPSMARPSRF
jgi:hypothetical protein